MNAWLAHHLHSLKIAWQRLLSMPLATLFTALVIGVAACLPAGLYALLDNFDRLAGGFIPRAEITVFLTTASSEAQALALASELNKESGVDQVRLVAKAEGLKQLQAAGLTDITAGLSENPLPHVLVLTTHKASANLLEGLAARIRAHSEVEQVQMDSDWLKRLTALLELGRNLIATLSLVLGLAVVAVTANTIRLQIYAQRDEIEVARLIGATERFIRRPFLYFGGLQGLAGGFAAWLLTLGGLWLLRDSVAGVASAYGLSFALAGLDLAEAAAVIAGTTLLGWLGAFFAVWQALRHIDRASL